MPTTPTGKSNQPRNLQSQSPQYQPVTPPRGSNFGAISSHRKGYLPLIVAVTLIKHYVRQFGVSYLAGQVYLNPHPKELALLNHV